MQPKPGSECGIRLDHSQEPLANSVSDTTGRTRHFQKAWKDLNGAVVKSARQLFHSGPLITTPLSRLATANRAGDRKAARIQITPSIVYTELSKNYWHSLIHFLADQASCESMCAAVKNFNVLACI